MQRDRKERDREQESDLPARLRLNCAPEVHECGADWSWSAVSLPDHDFWFVLDGRGEVTIDERKIEVHPGICFIWRPGDKPSALQDMRHRLTVFFCHFDALDEKGNLCSPLEFPRPMWVRDVNFFAASAHRAECLWRRGDEPAQEQSASLLTGLLWQLRDETLNAEAPADVALESLAAEIRRQPQRTWTLDDMARSVHLSRAQFTRRFRSAFRTSPARFVIQTRTERARQLLLETDLTLDQIAHLLGYRDAYFFARQFKQVTGQPPGSLRR